MADLHNAKVKAMVDLETQYRTAQIQLAAAQADTAADPSTFQVKQAEDAKRQRAFARAALAH